MALAKKGSSAAGRLRDSETVFHQLKAEISPLAMFALWEKNGKAK